MLAVDFGLKTTVVAISLTADPKMGVKHVTFPTIVGFSKDFGIVVGDEAVEESDLNPKNVFSGDFMFRARSETACQKVKTNEGYDWPQETYLGNDELNFKVNILGTEKLLTINWILMYFFKTMLDKTKEYLRENFITVTLTYSMSFTNSERELIETALKFTGVTVSSIIHPMAAMFAYDLKPPLENVTFIFDFDPKALKIIKFISVPNGTHKVINEKAIKSLGENELILMLLKSIDAALGDADGDDEYDFSIFDLDNYNELLNQIEKDLLDTPTLLLRIPSKNINLDLPENVLREMLCDEIVALKEEIQNLSMKFGQIDVIVMGPVAGWKFMQPFFTGYLERNVTIHCSIPGELVGVIGALKNVKMSSKVDTKSLKPQVDSLALINNNNKDEVQGQVVKVTGAIPKVNQTLKPPTNAIVDTTPAQLRAGIKEMEKSKEKLRDICLEFKKKALSLWKDQKINDLQKDMVIEKCDQTLVLRNNLSLDQLKYKLEEVTIHINFIINIDNLD